MPNLLYFHEPTAKHPPGKQIEHLAGEELGEGGLLVLHQENTRQHAILYEQNVCDKHNDTHGTMNVFNFPSIKRRSLFSTRARSGDRIIKRLCKSLLARNVCVCVCVCCECRDMGKHTALMAPICYTHINAHAFSAQHEISIIIVDIVLYRMHTTIVCILPFVGLLNLILQ